VLTGNGGAVQVTFIDVDGSLPPHSLAIDPVAVTKGPGCPR
jgi:hypothetical protein